MKMSSNLFLEIMTLLIQILTLFALVVTAYYVIKYWEETQAMKKEMIAQNELSSTTLKSSLLPVLDVEFEKVKADPEMAQSKIQFAYDIFIENKGNGPAFNVLIQRLIIPGENKQKLALRKTTAGKLKPLSERIHMIGRGERVKIHREHSDSYEYVRITVSYRDHFRDLHKSIFEGDRDGLKLKDYPVLKDYQGTKQNNSEAP